MKKGNGPESKSVMFESAQQLQSISSIPSGAPGDSKRTGEELRQDLYRIHNESIQHINNLGKPEATWQAQNLHQK